MGNLCLAKNIILVLISYCITSSHSFSSSELPRVIKPGKPKINSSNSYANYSMPPMPLSVLDDGSDTSNSVASPSLAATNHTANSETHVPSEQVKGVNLKTNSTPGADSSIFQSHSNFLNMDSNNSILVYSGEKIPNTDKFLLDPSTFPNTTSQMQHSSKATLANQTISNNLPQVPNLNPVPRFRAKPDPDKIIAHYSFDNVFQNHLGTVPFRTRSNTTFVTPTLNTDKTQFDRVEPTSRNSLPMGMGEKEVLPPLTEEENLCAPEGAIRRIPSRDGIIAYSYTDTSHADYMFKAMNYDWGADGRAYEIDAWRLYFEYYYSSFERQIWTCIHNIIKKMEKDWRLQCRFYRDNIRDIIIKSQQVSVRFSHKELNENLFSKYPSLDKIFQVQHSQKTRGIAYVIQHRDGHVEEINYDTQKFKRDFEQFVKNDPQELGELGQLSGLDNPQIIQGSSIQATTSRMFNSNQSAQNDLLEQTKSFPAPNNQTSGLQINTSQSFSQGFRDSAPTGQRLQKFAYNSSRNAMATRSATVIMPDSDNQTSTKLNLAKGQKSANSVVIRKKSIFRYPKMRKHAG